MRSSSTELLILDLLNKEKAHLTALEVYEYLRDRLPAVNPSTIYRALERLANQGKVSISDMGIGSAVFESVEQEIHHHLVCQKCGQIITLEHQDVDDFFAGIQRKNHFQIVTNHLILFGICERCQEADSLEKPQA
jgi:Fur family ferric uptake transcriptional regulator